MAYTNDEIMNMKPLDFVGRKKTFPKHTVLVTFPDGNLMKVFPEEYTWDEAESKRIVQSLQNIARRL